MTDKKRGATKSPRHKLLYAQPFRPVRSPLPQFAVVPKQLSYWDNNQDGDCVTAEEAYAKAAYSTMCNLPETFVPDAEVVRWARAHGVLNGATLTEVLDALKVDPFNVDGKAYLNGPYLGVDYSNVDLLKSAIEQGPVKIAIDADALPGTAGPPNGWFNVNSGHYGNTDHCVALSGHGTAEYLFGQLGVPLPSGLPGTTEGYLLFTWNSIGFVTQAWLMGTCQEAWLRNPTTVGQSPTPGPTPGPGPTPAPPHPFLHMLLVLLCTYGPSFFQPPFSDLLRLLCSNVVKDGKCSDCKDKKPWAKALRWVHQNTTR